jgi:epoxyqueuosine reductase
MGDHIYGCDICSEVCPWNRFAVESRRMLLIARHDLAGVTLRELLAMDQPQFAAVFRKTPMKRTKLSGLLRNACIAAANTRRLDCLDLLVKLCSHESSVVRAHAVWAVFRLMDRQQAIAQLSHLMAAETDPLVLQEYSAELGGQAGAADY